MTMKVPVYSGNKVRNRDMETFYKAVLYKISTYHHFSDYFLALVLQSFEILMLINKIDQI